MKTLSIAGTVAMFLVGGGILVHGVKPLHAWLEQLAAQSGALRALVGMTADGIVGILAGAIILAVVTFAGRLYKRPSL
jgi:predicted DNA repair protein MutK